MNELALQYESGRFGPITNRHADGAAALREPVRFDSRETTRSGNTRYLSVPELITVLCIDRCRSYRRFPPPIRRARSSIIAGHITSIDHLKSLHGAADVHF